MPIIPTDANGLVELVDSGIISREEARSMLGFKDDTPDTGHYSVLELFAAGIISVNEARRRVGLDKMAEGAGGAGMDVDRVYAKKGSPVKYIDGYDLFAQVSDFKPQQLREFFDNLCGQRWMND